MLKTARYVYLTTYATVIDVQVFTRDGVEKDKRALKLKICN